MSNEQKVWFITGSNSGFGYSLTEAVLAKGDRVIAATRHPEAMKPLVEQYPDTVKAVRLDITKSDEIKDAINTALRSFGQIDVLVNNAGFGTLGAVEEISEEKIRFLMQLLMGETPKTALHRYQFEVNCFGTLNLTKALLPHFRQRRSGHILNISSVAGFTAFPGTDIYSATKLAIEGYSEALAREIAPLGIKLTIVEPGGFRTEFAGDSLATSEDLIDDYEETAHEFVKMVQANSGQQPGDPDKAALAMIEVVESANPPLRLALGEDALNGVRQKMESFEKELKKWENVTLSTAFKEDRTSAVG